MEISVMLPRDPCVPPLYYIPYDHGRETNRHPMDRNLTSLDWAFTNNPPLTHKGEIRYNGTCDAKRAFLDRITSLKGIRDGEMLSNEGGTECL